MKTVNISSLDLGLLSGRIYLPLRPIVPGTEESLPSPDTDTMYVVSVVVRKGEEMPEVLRGLFNGTNPFPNQRLGTTKSSLLYRVRNVLLWISRVLFF